MISVCVIATNKYKEFIAPLVKSIERYFLVGHEVRLFIFSDAERAALPIPSYKYPEATLLRYEIMTQIPRKDYGDYIFYIDVDMEIVDHVYMDILDHIVAVQHPGYYKGGWGSTNVDSRSTAFLPRGKWGKYYAGGFQGGRTDLYYPIMEQLRDNIRKDTEKGIIAEWHDESHWNAYLAYNPPTTILDPSYCMPEARWKRRIWGVNHLEPKILALEKPKDYQL